jgi:hypothetical protein
LGLSFWELEASLDESYADHLLVVHEEHLQLVLAALVDPRGHQVAVRTYEDLGKDLRSRLLNGFFTVHTRQHSLHIPGMNYLHCTYPCTMQVIQYKRKRAQHWTQFVPQIVEELKPLLEGILQVEKLSLELYFVLQDGHV